MAVEGTVLHQHFQPEEHDTTGGGAEDPDLLELSSMALLRNSILRTIQKPGVQPMRSSSLVKSTSESSSQDSWSKVLQPSLEVKLLQKTCSSFDARKTAVGQSEVLPNLLVPETSELNEKPSIVFNELMESSSFDASDEFSKSDDSFLACDTDSINNAEVRRTSISNRNNLMLACRHFDNGQEIFEDCSTYNITCPDGIDVTMNSDKLDETNDLQVSNRSGIDSSSWTDISCSELTCFAGGETADSDVNSIRSRTSDKTEDHMYLSDTFFPTVIDGLDDSIESAGQSDTVDGFITESVRYCPTGKVTFENSVSKLHKTLTDKDLKNINNSDNNLDDSSNTRSSRKIRKRNRRSTAKDEHVVYDCPKCGVSYTVSSKTSTNVAFCLHCDLCTSVEPVFMKRQKLLWNTCRIC